MRRRRRPRADYVPFVPSAEALGEAERFAASFERGEVGDKRGIAAVRARTRKLYLKKEEAYRKIQAKLPVTFVIDVLPFTRSRD